MKKNEEIFTKLYEDNSQSWGSNESASGPGSTLEATAHIRKSLEFILEHFDIEVICDVPCGDFHFMKELSLNKVSYIGCDIVQSVIDYNNINYSNDLVQFSQLDIINDNCPKADLVFCKELFLHISNRDTKKVINNIKKSGAKYFMTNTYFLPVVPMIGGQHVKIDVPETNYDVPDEYRDGYLMGRIVNLFLPPFSLPDPLFLVGSVNKYLVMALWETKNISEFNI